MEVMIPDFHFSSARTSPQVSAPSSPRCSGQLYYYSAPTSPTYISQFYHNFDQFHADTTESSGGKVPFAWEETPGTPKSPAKKTITDNFDFAFDVNDDWETESLSAAELFDGGMIKPLKPPPRLQLPDIARISENKTSPRSKKEKPRTEIDPFAVAARKATAAALPERGRERESITNLANSSSRRASRSLSPFRDTQSPSIGQKKWSFKDFFLFRSASEGRADEKDTLKKHTAAYQCSRDGSGSGSGSRGKRRPVSAHEGYYKVNRAVSEDLKKKTFLPYKQGILGRFSFNPAVHALSNGFGFSRR